MIRDIAPADIDQIVALNDSEVQWTSPMDAAQLGELLKLTSYQRVAVEDNSVVGVLLAMPAIANYQNQNFDWFTERFRNFIYVDRIVIDHNFAGTGLGKHLYRNLFTFAAEQHCTSIVCEYTSQPLNRPSKAFHTAMGFTEVGKQQLTRSKKQVSMQWKPL